MADKFMFFQQFAENIREIFPDDELQQARAYKALCEYAIYETLPDDPALKSICIMAKFSIFKQEKRGGNHNPTGKNQYSDRSKQVKEVKTGQSGQSFLETETETVLKEKTNKKEKTDEILNNLFSKSDSQFVISDSFSIPVDKEPFSMYVQELGIDLVRQVERWLIKSKLGATVDTDFIRKQFVNFAQRQGKPLLRGT